MKKIAFMCCYNDVDYVNYAIQSMIDWVDEMIVIEGAFQITMAIGKPARSDDGTLEILEKWKSHPKMTIVHANEKEHKDQYNIGYQFAVQKKADWAILVDSDEVWTDNIKRIAHQAMSREILKKNIALSDKKYSDVIKEFRVQEYCFINDFQHWYEGVYPRIFKVEPGAFFVYDNEVQFPENGRGKHLVATIHAKDIYHYGYVRHNKRWQMKQDYMFEKDGNPSIKNDYKLEGNSYIIPKDLPIYKFVGKHPEVMQKHPFFGKTAEDIIYGENKTR